MPASEKKISCSLKQEPLSLIMNDLNVWSSSESKYWLLLSRHCARPKGCNDVQKDTVGSFNGAFDLVGEARG